MTIEEARMLIGRLPLPPHPQRWMDLGCGGGTFTLALAELLPAGSSIVAWDMNAFALRHIPQKHNGVNITTQQADMLRAPFPTSLDGILMANALHFVKDQGILLSATKKALRENGCLLLVEYDTDMPVPTWVPFPVSFQRSIVLLPQHGYSVPQQLGDRPSAYGRGDLYAAFARRVASSNPR